MAKIKVVISDGGVMGDFNFLLKNIESASFPLLVYASLHFSVFTVKIFKLY